MKKKKFKFGLKTINFITLPVGAAILLINYLYFIKNSQVSMLLDLLAAVIILGVPLIYRYMLISRMRKMEALFPVFLRDITENINAGMTLPQAIRAASANNYDILSPHIKEINARISWGIPFEKVLNDFASTVGSDNLKRTVHAIVEAHRSGGTMNTILESVGESLKELEKIKKERTASVYAQMINGYLIYFVFLGVMVGMNVFLLPTFEWGGLEGQPSSELGKVLPDLFRHLVLIQGVFAGLAIGKMAEGTIFAGVKHSLVLAVVGFSVFILFSPAA
ncbi:MAG: type II secretion system F family protein [Candidatus Aenigmatarchaeota archaeon]